MQDLVSEYQALLLADETTVGLNRALALAHAVAAGGRHNRERWVNLENGSAGPPNARRRVSGLWVARRADEVIGTLTKLSLRAQEAMDEAPALQVSMLFDALLIIFQQAYFALWPKVVGNKHQEVLRAFLTFARTLPRVADQLHVEGLVRLAMEESEAAVDLFRAAVASTPSDDHDFLSRVQLYWTVLMEADRSADAFEFLNEIASRVTRNDFTEFQGLLSTTFKVATHQLS
jgi:tetratricopeptide (TPR) repeat protein